MRKVLLWLCLCFSIITFVGCHKAINSGYKGRIMVLSASSDGEYVISSSVDRHAVLWNLQQHTYKVLPMYPVNIYSAYFIKGTHDFMLQNSKTNQVIVENVFGKIIKTFNPGFPTYGQAITSDLNYYFGNKEEQHTIAILNGKRKQLYGNKNLGFFSAGKLFNVPFGDIKSLAFRRREVILTSC
jgi:hypothetical protein